MKIKQNYFLKMHFPIRILKFVNKIMHTQCGLLLITYFNFMPKIWPWDPMCNAHLFLYIHTYICTYMCSLSLCLSPLLLSFSQCKLSYVHVLLVLFEHFCCRSRSRCCSCSCSGSVSGSVSGSALVSC